ncbi:hypothetical protein CWI39_1461p0010 [Hamiltosporidium magnivora]|uniref:Ubiquitin-like domain-containing protein n=1 Tax=Hamiltosporidium magnivora TaxID=148818 RepID=A0A4Q9L2U0_9MICR|nr:hypothetical protein CWI39_1461p0010 [Hamiltosporidium magnivora]
MAKLVLNDVSGNTFFEKEYTHEETVLDVKKYVIKKIKEKESNEMHGAFCKYDINETLIAENMNERKEKETEVIEENNKHNVEDISTQWIQIIFNGKIVSETVPLVSLGENGDLFLKFDVKKNCTSIFSESCFNVKKRIIRPHEMEEEVSVEMNQIDRKVFVKILDNGRKIKVDPSKLVTNKGILYYVTEKKKKTDFLATIRSAILGIRTDLLVKILVIVGLMFTRNREFAFLLMIILLLRAMSTLPLKIKTKYNGSFELLYKSVLSFVFSMIFITFDDILQD